MEFHMELRDYEPLALLYYLSKSLRILEFHVIIYISQIVAILLAEWM